MESEKRILIISLDSDLFKSANGESVSGDALNRHKLYTKNLKNLTNKNSEIYIIVYSRFNKKYKTIQFKNLKIIPTKSFHRIFFSIDITIITIKLFLRDWKPNVITCQNPWGEAFILLLFSKIIKCSFVSQIHTDLLSIYWLKQNPIFNLIRLIQAFLIFNLSSIIRTVSDGISLKLHNFFFIPKNKLHNIPVGITINRNSTINIFKTGIKKEKIINILYVGRFEKEKNLDLWLNTSFLVAKKYENARFTLIGDGRENIRIRRKINLNKYARNFYLPGFLSYSELIDIYEKADIFLLTSFYEGFGRVILEAMKFGIPCVSTNSIGPSDLIKNGKNGFISKKRDPSELAKMISLLIENKSLYSSMSKRSLKIAEEFNFEKISNKYIKTLISI